MNSTPYKKNNMATARRIEDSLQYLQDHFPAAYEQAIADGYEWAGPDILGRCVSNSTLFLEVNANQGTVLGWVFDSSARQFVGSAYEIHGTLDTALATARHLVESTYAEDSLSGSAPRHEARSIVVQPAL